MSVAYEYNVNPFQDLLINLILNDQEISNKKLKKEINAIFINFLQNILNDSEDSLLLDFEILKKKQQYKIVGKNFISSLWLSGYFFTNVDEIMKTNNFIIGERKYTYNEKTHELKILVVDEKETKAKKK